MFKFEVQTDSTGDWSSNSMEYSTMEEAQAAAIDLQSRWMLVTAWRVIPAPTGTN
jgi:hypothetical protein